MNIALIGNIAAVLTTLSFLPQALQTLKTKDTKSLSLPMYSMFVTGVGLWIFYGYQSQILPILIGNVITFLFAGIILFFKLTEKKWNN